uniref:Uncharacterized protein n=1 Tax=viral metagenome TaxID=1070528 RepID=A0A6M3LAI7_9ZZZZ
MKVIEVKCCKECPCMKKYINAKICQHPHKVPMSYSSYYHSWRITDINTYPDWCPLPEADKEKIK